MTGRRTDSRAGRRASGVVAVVLCLVALITMPVAAAETAADPAGWTVTPTPDPLSRNGTFSGVSCVGDDCMSVGSFTDERGHQAPMAEVRDSQGWSVVAVPFPSDVTGAAFNGVSCVSAAACVAVGVSLYGDEQTPMAQRWDGRQWSAQSVPTVSGGFSGVSCGAANRCVAVGWSAESPLVAAWDGTDWTIGHTPSPTPTPYRWSFTSVSCGSATSCVAVGSHISANSGAVAARWDGAAWTLMELPWSFGGALNGVSCSSALVCTAVGSLHAIGDDSGALALRWDGAVWAVQSVPASNDFVPTGLLSLSCPTSTTCRALGTGKPRGSTGPGLLLAAHWNGTTWSLRTLPGAPTGDPLTVTLAGVSCGSSSRCVAAGHWAPNAGPGSHGIRSLTLVNRWADSAWNVEDTPNPQGSREGGLADVACPQPGACFAVGSAVDAAGYYRPEAQRFDGVSWTPQPIPTPAEDHQAQLRSLSCHSAVSCVAVGAFYDGDDEVPFAEHWDGTRWTARTLPRPAGDGTVHLTGISCTAPLVCLAVGSSSPTGGNGGPVVAWWNGVAWTVERVDGPSWALASWLTDVSCPTITACVAVGNASGRDTVNTAFALRRAGAGWTVETIPATVYRPAVSAVSCTSADDCIAVGSYSASNGYSAPLAFRRAGQSWAVEPGPQPAGTQMAELYDVSCSPGACTAVGYHALEVDAGRRGGDRPLIATWNGRSWSVTPAPYHYEPNGSRLKGVACSGSCVAVGQYNGTSLAMTGPTALPDPTALPGAITVPPSDPPLPGPSVAAANARSGYWALGVDGHVYPFGAAPSLGHTTAGAVDLEPTPTGRGYWTLNRNGSVSPFGDATPLGNVEVARLAKGDEPASLSATPSGKGYWVFTNRGRAVPFGDAPFFGDVSTLKLNGPVLGSVATPSGRGYYLVAADGGIFAFGDASFAGSMGGKKLNAPVQSLVPDADGKGYWLVASDGGIFAFDAPFLGSMGGTKLNKPVVGMVRYGDGYLMVGADGGIFNFSTSPFAGSLGDKPPAAPVVAVAALPTA